MKNNKDYLEAVKAIKEAILRSQYRTVSTANREQLSLYYGIGRYVSENSRVGFWGTGAIEQISNDLQKELPGLRGFSAANIKKMRQFYEEWEPVLNCSLMATEMQYVDNDIVTNRSLPMSEINRFPDKINRSLALSDLKVNENLLLIPCQASVNERFNWETFMQIGFTHHLEIIRNCNDLEVRLFYINECATRFWNYYTLRDYLKADLYGKRGSMPNNFEQTMPDVRQALKAIGVFKDEYLLDYFNVEQYGERDDDIDERVLEQGIVANIRKFIMTFGQDFSFIGNQYRVEVADEELFIDLLFFNRELNSLVAVELKSGKFRSSYLGQLNTYLSALDEYVRKPHENASIGIILCKEMNNTFVQFAVRDYSKPMGVATYRTSEEMPERLRKALPDIEELKKCFEV
jgi:predicted nuclease of restriction endonuclease-like (RecB) superfamily